jgi:hypothetical protein
VLGLMALAGCTSSGEPGAGSATASPAAPSESATAATPTPAATEPALPALDPQGDAAANLPFFSSIVAAVWATPQNASGRAYIDALVAAGFDKGAMQVTQDQSTVGDAAESIQFSVVWKGDCLVGQVGPATGQPVAIVLPVLADGSCLVGETRAIDW